MNEHMYERKIQKRMYEARDKAFTSLAGYKFFMFGYWAAQWVNLNKLLPKPWPSPFKDLVKFSRGDYDN